MPEEMTGVEGNERNAREKRVALEKKRHEIVQKREKLEAVAKRQAAAQSAARQQTLATLNKRLADIQAMQNVSVQRNSILIQDCKKLQTEAASICPSMSATSAMLQHEKKKFADFVSVSRKRGATSYGHSSLSSDLLHLRPHAIDPVDGASSQLSDRDRVVSTQNAAALQKLLLSLSSGDMASTATIRQQEALRQQLAAAAAAAPSKAGGGGGGGTEEGKEEEDRRRDREREDERRRDEERRREDEERERRRKEEDRETQRRRDEEERKRKERDEKAGGSDVRREEDGNKAEREKEEERRRKEQLAEEDRRKETKKEADRRDREEEDSRRKEDDKQREGAKEREERERADATRKEREKEERENAEKEEERKKEEREKAEREEERKKEEREKEEREREEAKQREKEKEDREREERAKKEEKEREQRKAQEAKPMSNEEAERAISTAFDGSERIWTKFLRHLASQIEAALKEGAAASSQPDMYHPQHSPCTPVQLAAVLNELVCNANAVAKVGLEAAAAAFSDIVRRFPGGVVPQDFIRNYLWTANPKSYAEAKLVGFLSEGGAEMWRAIRKHMDKIAPSVKPETFADAMAQVLLGTAKPTAASKAKVADFVLAVHRSSSASGAQPALPPQDDEFDDDDDDDDDTAAAAHAAQAAAAAAAQAKANTQPKVSALKPNLSITKTGAGKGGAAAAARTPSAGISSSSSSSKGLATGPGGAWKKAGTGGFGGSRTGLGSLVSTSTMLSNIDMNKSDDDDDDDDTSSADLYSKTSGSASSSSFLRPKPSLQLNSLLSKHTSFKAASKPMEGEDEFDF